MKRADHNRLPAKLRRITNTVSLPSGAWIALTGVAKKYGVSRSVVMSWGAYGVLQDEDIDPDIMDALNVAMED